MCYMMVQIRPGFGRGRSDSITALLSYHKKGGN